MSVVAARFPHWDVRNVRPHAPDGADLDLDQARFCRIWFRAMPSARSLRRAKPSKIKAKSGFVSEECRLWLARVLVDLVGSINCAPQAFAIGNGFDSDPRPMEHGSNDVTTKATVPQSVFPAEQSRLEIHWPETKIGAVGRHWDTKS